MHKKIRFIGFAIPATPAGLLTIGPADGGSVVGTYLGNADVERDLDRRVAVMEAAVETARSKIQAEKDIITVFVAPEFYFHGLHGPYIFDDDQKDPVELLREKLKQKFHHEKYAGWIFFFGSAITTRLADPEHIFDSNRTLVRNNVVRNLAEQWQAAFGPLKNVLFDMLVDFIKVCHSYPVCEVRNRDIIVSNVPVKLEGESSTHLMTTEKYFVSNEDFVLYEPDGKNVITEQMTAYPFIDLSDGDAKRSAFDVHAIFEQNIGRDARLAYGVEICLDHADARLRRNIERTLPRGGHVDAHIIPSCGMQIMQASVAARSGGFVFNCDGQSPIGPAGRSSGQAEIQGVDCLFADYQKAGSPYAAHSQLARVHEPAVGDDPEASGSSNASFHSLPPDQVESFALENPPGDLNEYFAGGPRAGTWPRLRCRSPRSSRPYAMPARDSLSDRQRRCSRRPD